MVIGDILFRIQSRTLRGAVVIVLAVFLAGCEQPPVQVEEIVRPVRYTHVVPIGAAQTRIFSGVTKAALEADLSFKVSGTINRLDVNVGEQVAAGELVASLDPTDYRVMFGQAEAGLEQARAELRNARANFARTRELYENRSVSKSDLDNSRAAAESAAARVRTALQQLEAARLRLSYTRLEAPQACTVASKHAEINQNVLANQPVVTLNCGDCAEITVDVPGVYIGRVENGTEVEVTLAALPGEVLHGVVSEVGIATDGGRVAYPVTIVLQERCEAVRSGMAANVALVISSGDSEEGMVVPFVAVGEDQTGRFVFVLEPTENEYWRVRRRAVVVGGSALDGVLILSGLEEGELIATAGVRRLTDGQIVSLLGQTEA